MIYFAYINYSFILSRCQYFFGNARYFNIFRQRQDNTDSRPLAASFLKLDKVFQIKETASPIFDNEYVNDFLRSGDCVWNVWRYIFSLEFLKKHKLSFIDNIDCGEDLEFVVRALTKAERTAFYHLDYTRIRTHIQP